MPWRRSGVAPKEITWKRGVDVLCFGGTKNGMAVGDCVVFFDRELSVRIRVSLQASRTTCLQDAFSVGSVGRLARVGSVARQRPDMPTRWPSDLPQSSKNYRGSRSLRPFNPTPCLSIFPTEVSAGLRRSGWVFYDFIGVGTSRLMCSWETTDAEIDRFTADVASHIASMPIRG